MSPNCRSEPDATLLKLSQALYNTFSWLYYSTNKRKYHIQARSQGGSDDPPQLPIPKILFHPLAILFHPWNMWMTSHGQCPRGGGACECPRGGCFPIFRRADDVTRTMSKGGGVPVNVQEWGRFSNWWRDADNVQGGGGCLVFHPSKFRPPPPPGWLATGRIFLMTAGIVSIK